MNKNVSHLETAHETPGMSYFHEREAEHHILKEHASTFRANRSKRLGKVLKEIVL